VHTHSLVTMVSAYTFSSDRATEGEKQNEQKEGRGTHRVRPKAKMQNANQCDII